MISYADTQRIKDLGNDIINLANKYSLEINELFKKITNIPYDTKEWTGNKAEEYAAIVTLDKQEYVDFYEEIKTFAKKIIEAGESIEKCSKSCIEGLKYNE